MQKILLAFFIILAVLGIGFGSGFYYGKSLAPAIPPEDLDFSLFWEAWHAIEKNYVDPERIDRQQMIYGAIRGMLDSLEDPHTFFMEPDEFKAFEKGAEGRFEGVGMEIGIRDNQLTVIAPLEGTPADRAGLRAGDKIIKIEDKDTQDMSVDMAVLLIRGPKGTEVILTVLREGWSEPKEFTVIRETIDIPSLKWELLEGNIAYIKLYGFTRVAAYDFNVAAAEIMASPAEKIILDLRNNTGGYLDVAQQIAGWFLKKGEIVAFAETISGEIETTYKAEGASKLLPYPAIVLVNQGSASASEILAGALRDNRGIKLVGETTFGKGSIQELKELTEGGVKITTARWLTPAGNLIDEAGLEPDVAVELTDKDIEEDKDPQLDKALEILREII